MTGGGVSHGASDSGIMMLLFDIPSIRFCLSYCMVPSIRSHADSPYIR